MRKGAGAFLLLFPLGTAPAQNAPSEQLWKLSGYYLNLFTRSTTIFPEGEGERYVLDLNRLRLRLEGQAFKALSVDVQYDNELLLGDYLRTRQFALIKDRVPDTSLDLESTYGDGRSAVGRHRIYRAVVSWSGEDTRISIGRQRIAWGTGRFWSPLDVLNPFDAVRLERDIRPGVDAVLVDRTLGPLGKLDMAYAPATEHADAAAAAYVHGNARGTDYSVLVGTFRGERMVGADFSASLGGLGIRGEATASRPDTGRSFARVLLGADYGFANTLTLTAELYFNGQGSADRTRYDVAGLFEGRIRSLARRYGAIAASYEMTPLFKVVVYGIVNVDDRSRLIWPGLEYSLASSIDIGGGVQYFSGSSGSEYGRFRDVRYLQARWFF